MVKHWLRKGADPGQIVIGVALFGRSYKLADPKDFQPGSRTIGDGYAGQWSKTPGFLSYYEVCDRVGHDDWIQYSDKAGSPFAVRKDQWISYEDHRSITRKVRLVTFRRIPVVIVCVPRTPVSARIRGEIDAGRRNAVVAGFGRLQRDVRYTVAADDHCENVH